MTTAHTSPPDARSATTPADGARADDPLAWLSHILWPDGSARLVVERRGDEPPQRRSGPTLLPAHAAGSPRWWASPTTHEPRVLIPADSAGASKRAVRRYHDGFDLGRWARSVAAEVSMVSPAIAHRLLDKRAIVLDGPDDSADRGVLGGLRRIMGRDDLRFAISLASPKTNRKPVIQLLDDAGLTLGWAKVGWNPWTERLVTNEARWLATPSNPPIITPIVLEHDVIAGRRIVVLSAVAPGRRPKLRAAAQPDPAVLRAISGRGTVSERPIVETGWWSSVEAVLPHAEPDERRAVERAVATADDLVFSIGAWHGDFTPWNVMTVRGLAEIIDWEFAADEVPLGFDLCHYHTQIAAEIRHLPADQAIDHSARLSPQGLAQLGVDPHTQLATWRLYLVELVRRTLALRAAGLDTGNVRQGRAAVDRLTTTTGFEATRPAG